MNPFALFFRAVRADHQALRRHRAKYNADRVSARDLPVDVLRRIGFQMMVAIRLMRLARDLRIPYAAQLASRLIRHLYSAEVHWDAEFAEGVSLIHGVGLVVSHGARVGSGCILFHNVTLGESVDPETREQGAPTLEDNVHVGPGVALLGPITIGAETKIMAGSVVDRSVPCRALVRPVGVVVTARPNRV